jgi:hypothetical protein
MEFHAKFLEPVMVVVTPGAVFGPSGNNVDEATIDTMFDRIERMLSS